MHNPFTYSSVRLSTLIYFTLIICAEFLPVLSQMYDHIVKATNHVTEFVKPYTKSLMFLMNVLLKNNSLFE
jgi:hypothetical protein